MARNVTRWESDRGNLRAVVVQRPERFFRQDIPAPAPPSGPPIGSHRGRVWVYVQGVRGVDGDADLG